MAHEQTIKDDNFHNLPGKSAPAGCVLSEYRYDLFFTILIGLPDKLQKFFRRL